MKLTSVRAPSIIAFTLLALGCSSTEETKPSLGNASFSGTVRDAVVDTPIGEATICAVDLALDCATTASDGSYRLEGLPDNTRVKITATQATHASAVALFDTNGGDQTVNAVLFDKALLESIWSDAGHPLDMSKGHIGIALNNEADTGGASGYTASISPAAGEGPYFTKGTGVDVTATATTDSGGVAFINVSEGDYTVTVQGPGSCQASVPIAIDSDGTFPATVKSGYLTYVVAQCPDGGVGGGGGAGGSGSGGAGGAGGN